MPTLTYTQGIPASDSVKYDRIDPSIYEGSYLMSSMFGPDQKGIRLVRYPPTLLVAPIISGPVAIDEPTNSKLTCWRGVVDSAPTAYATFQWRLDGVDIPGETSIDLFTLNSMDKTIATCFVRFENNQGFIEVESNGIALSRIEEIVIDEAEWYTVTGQSGKSVINVMDADMVFIQGGGVIGGLTNFGLHHLAITGLSPEDGLVNFDAYTYVLTGFNQDTHQNVYETSGYAIRLFELLDTMVVLNPGAEDGVNDWTITTGAMVSVTTQSGNVDPYSGSKFFYGGDGQPASEAYQDIAVPPAREADIDDANIGIYAGLKWVQNSYNESDEVHLWFEFLNDVGTVIGTETMYGPMVPWKKTWADIWSGLYLVPFLTRTIRVHLDFNRVSTSGNLNGYVDDISLELHGIVIP